jgi:hypothetical protein
VLGVSLSHDHFSLLCFHCKQAKLPLFELATCERYILKYFHFKLCFLKTKLLFSTLLIYLLRPPTRCYTLRKISTSLKCSGIMGLILLKLLIVIYRGHAEISC